MPDEIVNILGVRHPVGESYLATDYAFIAQSTVFKALDKQIESLDKPVVGLEIKPEELEVYIKLAENPGLRTTSPYLMILENPFHKFWSELLLHAHSKALGMNKNIKFVALDSGQSRKYIGKKYPTPEEKNIMTREKTVRAQKFLEHYEETKLFVVYLPETR